MVDWLIEALDRCRGAAQLPSVWARSTTRMPLGSMSPASSSRSTRDLLSADHLLPGLRGVTRSWDLCSSSERGWLSIHPRHSVSLDDVVVWQVRVASGRGDPRPCRRHHCHGHRSQRGPPRHPRRRGIGPETAGLQALPVRQRRQRVRRPRSPRPEGRSRLRAAAARPPRRDRRPPPPNQQPMSGPPTSGPDRRRVPEYRTPRTRRTRG